ncbi:hypothetical protein NPIL_498571 [Nephila pilipes]|uniref:Uncharacterized protein n=1 Tax=Nephila pilipes TaxID=299642 RepID=A0A8X6PN53_NEPPI|nr:hypothetical protein NPIL_498571 [Nephila pilipes]
MNSQGDEVFYRFKAIPDSYPPTLSEPPQLFGHYREVCNLVKGRYLMGGVGDESIGVLHPSRGPFFLLSKVVSNVESLVCIPLVLRL